MQVLKRIESMAQMFSDSLAFNSRYGSITYEELWKRSGILANWIDEKLGDDKNPVPVFGHKSPEMFVCFLACVKSGRAYCPIDISMSEDRISDIVSMTGSSIVLAVEELNLPEVTVIDKETLWDKSGTGVEISEDKWVSAEDNFYIIFTSGSTGKPKGVQITSDNLTNFVHWMKDLGGEKAGGVFMNQAPFSFDLSVMDIYTSLTTGCTLWSVDKQLQQDVASTLAYIKEGNIDYWVSTPSFADMCLADKEFSEEHIGRIKAFLFCGEKLAKRTAGKLMEKFPSAKVINTYGPTESTVAVTSVEITREMIAGDDELPIGVPKPGSRIYVAKEKAGIAEAGEKGEIIIAGDTVSPGYYKNPEKTEEVFVPGASYGENSVVYRTGDEGYFAEDGMLYYSGRIDLQIKFHGYRIELGDIEKNLVSIDDVSAAAVLPKSAEGRIRHLVAFLVAPNLTGEYSDRKAIKEQLKVKLPDYMVPKKIVFVEKMPLTDNGKIDRKKLGEML